MKLTKVLAGLLLALAVVLAVVAWMMSRQAPRQVVPVAVPTQAEEKVVRTPRDDSPRFERVVAAQWIAPGRAMTVNDLKLADFSAPVAGAYASVDVLIGKTVMVGIEPGQPVREEHLVAGLSLQLEKGERAVSIAVKESMAAGNHVRPGDFVDVFFTLQDDGRADKVDTQTRLLLARSRVLAYGNSTVEDPPPTIAQRKKLAEKESAGVSGGRSSSREEARGRADNVNTAVLAVPLEDVQRITLAEKFGQLNLALRHPDDQALPDPVLFAALPPALQPVAMHAKTFDTLPPSDKAFAGLRLKDLAAGSGKAQPSNRSSSSAISPRVANLKTSPKPSLETIELYSGTAVQTVSY